MLDCVGYPLFGCQFQDECALYCKGETRSALEKSGYIYAGAEFSDDFKHRYILWRQWNDVKNPKICIFVMLNPSTARGIGDDPTVLQCVAMAKLWGFDRLEIVNLFSFRATDLTDLYDKKIEELVTSWTWHFIQKSARSAQCVVCAWGNHGSYLGQNQKVLDMLFLHMRPERIHILGLTMTGQPRHPLFVKRSTQPSVWK
jgi:hypothetical protein